MRYSIRWKDCSKKEYIEKHLEEKIEKFNDFNFTNGDVKAEVAFYKEGTFEVRISVPVKHKGVLVGEATNEDPISAINDAISKVLDQMRKVKTQFHDNK